MTVTHKPPARRMGSMYTHLHINTFLKTIRIKQLPSSQVLLHVRPPYHANYGHLQTNSEHLT